jgi:hypothetical protein
MHLWSLLDSSLLFSHNFPPTPRYMLPREHCRHRLPVSWRSQCPSSRFRHSLLQLHTHHHTPPLPKKWATCRSTRKPQCTTNTQARLPRTNTQAHLLRPRQLIPKFHRSLASHRRCTRTHLPIPVTWPCNRRTVFRLSSTWTTTVWYGPRIRFWNGN